MLGIEYTGAREKKKLLTSRIVSCFPFLSNRKIDTRVFQICQKKHSLTLEVWKKHIRKFITIHDNNMIYDAQFLLTSIRYF